MEHNEQSLENSESIQSQSGKYLWLTIPNCSHVENIKVKPKSSPTANLKDLDGHVWFKESEDKEALEFLKKVKESIREHYKAALKKLNDEKRADWMDKKW